MNDVALSKLIDKKVLAQLMRVSPLRGFLRFMLEISIILATIIISWKFIPWPLWIFSWLIVATRQHAILVLMHDTAHFNLSSIRWLNNVIGEFVGFLHFMTMHGYRNHHKSHHVVRHLNTAQDPDWARKQNGNWVFPMERERLKTLILRDLFALNTQELFKEAKDAKNNKLESKKDYVILTIRLFFYISLIAINTYFELWTPFLLLWVAPMFTFLKAILRIRAICDHFMLPSTNFINKTRTILCPWWERALIGPCNICIHTPHHLFAGSPYYNLMKAHHILMKNSEYAKYCHIETSYFTTLMKLTYQSEKGVRHAVT
jgi:fatty acid desaturase